MKQTKSNAVALKSDSPSLFHLICTYTICAIIAIGIVFVAQYILALFFGEGLATVIIGSIIGILLAFLWVKKTMLEPNNETHQHVEKFNYEDDGITKTCVYCGTRHASHLTRCTGCGEIDPYLQSRVNAADKIPSYISVKKEKGGLFIDIVMAFLLVISTIVVLYGVFAIVFSIPQIFGIASNLSLTASLFFGMGVYLGVLILLVAMAIPTVPLYFIWKWQHSKE